MHDLIISDNQGRRVVYRTDLNNLSADNFTVMEVIGVSDAEESKGMKFPKVPNTIGALKAFCQAGNYNLDAQPVGNKGVVATESMFKATLATPGAISTSGVTSTKIDLSWAAVPNATGYILERATNSGFTTGLTTVYTGANLSFSNTGLTTGTTYYYRLRATAANYTTSANSATKQQATS